MFRAKVPAVASVKIALRLGTNEVLPELDNVYRTFLSGQFLPQPFDTLLDLPLVQRVEAYQSTRILSRSEDGTLSTKHSVTAVACYLFEKNPIKYWMAADVMEEWPTAGIDTSSEELEFVERVDSQPHAFGGWREKRGHEEADAWKWERK